VTTEHDSDKSDISVMDTGRLHLTRLVIAHGLYADNLRSVHALIVAGLGEDPGRYLFRVEPKPHPVHGLTVLIQTPKPPSWTPGNQIRQIDGPKDVTDRIQPGLTNGRYFRFRLRAAPPSYEGDRTRRRAAKGLEKQQAWMTAQQERGGFEIINLQTIDEGWLSGTEPGRRRVVYLSVRYEGILRITNGQLLWETLLRGLGPGKSFGFGMLSLMPA
jgi:CRISPR system Cascade subunit CasE